MVMEAMDQMETWKEKAKAIHQEFYEVFGDRDWDRYDVSQQELLLRNVGFALYGQPDQEPDQAANLSTGYSKEKLNHIHKLCEKIHQQNPSTDGTIDIAIVYVIVRKLDSNNPHLLLPIFRIPLAGASDDSSNIFIDSVDCRVYAGWAKYLKNNNLPKCTYCYPCNGVYLGDTTDQVIVDVSSSPACRLSRRLLNGADNVGTAVAVGATLLSMSALAVPIASPVLLAAALSEFAVGVYGFGRGVGSIVDRKQHEQSISVRNAESRSAYIALGANALGLVAVGASKITAKLASRGKVLSTTEQILVNATKVSSITANGIGIANSLLSLKDKFKSGEAVTGLEIFQLTSSVLFFTHSIVSFKSAKRIVRDTQEDVIKSFEASLRSNRHKKGFQRLARNTRAGLDAMNGDAKIIKSLTNISNPDDFFAGVVRVQKHHALEASQMRLEETGRVLISNQLIVDPHEFASLPTSERQMILGAETIALVTSDQPVLQAGPSNSGKSLESNALKDFLVDGMAVFAELESSDAQRILLILRKTLSHDVLHTAVELAYVLGFTKAAEMIGFLDFVSSKIMQILNDMEWAYLECLNIAKSTLGFNEAKFNNEYGIEGSNRQQHFLNLIKALYSVGQMSRDLVSDYKKYKETLSISMGCDRHLSAVCEESPDSESLKRRMSEVWREPLQADIASQSMKRLKLSEADPDAARSLCLGRDFSTAGQLSVDDIFLIAAMITGKEANKYNSAVDFLEDNVAVVVVMDPVEEERIILVTSNVSENTILAQLID